MGLRDEALGAMLRSQAEWEKNREGLRMGAILNGALDWLKENEQRSIPFYPVDDVPLHKLTVRELVGLLREGVDDE